MHSSSGTGIDLLLTAGYQISINSTLTPKYLATYQFSDTSIFSHVELSRFHRCTWFEDAGHSIDRSPCSASRRIHLVLSFGFK